MKSNIALIGFMGSGKTTIGKKLSEYTKKIFIDLDEEIEKKEKSSTSKIFYDHGEEYFRKIETLEIENQLRKENIVLSLGGGAYCNEKNINLVRSKSKVIYLSISFENILVRMTEEEIKKRPLFKDIIKAKNLFYKRQKFYNQNDFCINIENNNVDYICNLILELL